MEEDILNQLGTPSEEPTEEIKVEEKKKSSSKPLDDEVIASMMANGDNTKGMFEPDESEVKDLLKYYNNTRKTMKGLGKRGGRLSGGAMNRMMGQFMK